MWGKHFLFISLLFRNVRQLDDLVVHETKVCSALWLTSCIAFNVKHLFFGCKKSVLSIWCILWRRQMFAHCRKVRNSNLFQYRCSNFDLYIWFANRFASLNSFFEGNSSTNSWYWNGSQLLDIKALQIITSANSFQTGPQVFLSLQHLHV